MLIRQLKKKIVLILPILFFAGCAEEPVSAPTPKKANVVKKKKVIVSTVKPLKAEIKEKKKIIPVYSYDPAGKADPFYPFLATMADQDSAEESEKNLVPLTELEKYALTQFKVVAVMTIGKKKVAMIEDTEGVGHSVNIGVLIGQNKGRVVNIENGVVYVEEKSRDIMGEIKSNIIELAIETSEGGKK